MIPITKEFLEQTLGLQNVVSADANFMCSCPFSHNHSSGKDERPSFGINKKTGAYNCFACKERGRRLNSLVTLLLNVSTEEAQKILGEGSVSVPDTGLLIQKMGTLLTPSKIAASFSAVEHIGIPFEYSLTLPDKVGQFLQDKKHVFNDAVSFFQIGYCATGHYAGRLILPVYLDGKARGFIARDTTNEAPTRYLYPPGFPKNEVLFNIDNINEDYIFLVEGSFDVIQLWQYGIKNAVALLCSDISQEQIALLLKHKVREIVLFLDNDLAGQKAQVEIAKKLGNFFELYETRYPVGVTDPGELSERNQLSYVLRSVRSRREPVKSMQTLKDRLNKQLLET